MHRFHPVNRYRVHPDLPPLRSEAVAFGADRPYRPIAAERPTGAPLGRGGRPRLARQRANPGARRARLQHQLPPPVLSAATGMAQRCRADSFKSASLATPTRFRCGVTGDRDGLGPTRAQPFWAYYQKSCFRRQTHFQHSGRPPLRQTLGPERFPCERQPEFSVPSLCWLRSS
jgi:hypothetical protein